METVRTPDSPRQGTVCYLGELNTSAAARWRKTIQIFNAQGEEVQLALVVAATQAARRPGPLRTWARLVQRRKGKKVARVALARRLAEICYQVWKEEADFLAVRRRGGVRG